MEEKNIRQKLLKIQIELKSPKNQRNNFGNYNYRSCEDILEAVKPHLKETNTSLVITDDIIQLGDRYYIKATAQLLDNDTDGVIEASGIAREDQTKKGMADSQITGATSSYSRKYALNGLFCIDDNKDADTLNNNKEFTVPQTSKDLNPVVNNMIENSDVAKLKKIIKDRGANNAEEALQIVNNIAGLNIKDMKELEEKATNILKFIN